jgi:hypothetical protein
VSDQVRPGPAVGGYLCPTRVHVAAGNVCPNGVSVSRSQHGGGAHEPHAR